MLQEKGVRWMKLHRRRLLLIRCGCCSMALRRTDRRGTTCWRSSTYDVCTYVFFFCPPSVHEQQQQQQQQQQVPKTAGTVFFNGAKRRTARSGLRWYPDGEHSFHDRGCGVRELLTNQSIFILKIQRSTVIFDDFFSMNVNVSAERRRGAL